MAKKKEPRLKRYIVTDGELVLELEREGKWYCVTCPFQPGLITQARTLEEAFEMARDAREGLALVEKKLARRQRKRAPRRGAR